MFGLLEEFGALVSSAHSDPLSQTISNFTHAFWILVFGFLVFWRVPKKRKLILKDLRKDRQNLFAKAALLELRLAERRKVQAKKNERAEVEEKIRAMKEELRSAE